MKKSGESAADALNRIMAAMSNLSVIDKLNPSLIGLQLSDEEIADLLADKFAGLDQAVIDAERDLNDLLRRMAEQQSDGLDPVKILQEAMLGRLPSLLGQIASGSAASLDASALLNHALGLDGPSLRRSAIDSLNAQDYWGENYAGLGDRASRNAPGALIRNLFGRAQEIIDEVTQDEIDAARRRLEDARRLRDTTERTLTEEEIQAEIMRRRIEIMEDIQELAGGADQLAALQASYFEYAFSEAERAQMATDFASGKLADFNSSLGRTGESAIDSIGELRAYIETLDLTTEAGQAAYVEALRVVEWLKMLDGALGSLNPEIAAVFQTIQNALRQTEQARGVSEFERAMALRDLSRWANSGNLPNQDDLNRTLNILSRVTDQDFQTAAERDLAAAKQYAALLKLEQLGQDLLSPAAQQMDYLRRTAESAERQSDSLESIDRAVNSGRSLVLADEGPSARVMQSESTAALAEEVRQLRADLAQLTAAQMLPMRDLRDIFQRWEIDGLPPTREDEETQTIAVLQVA
jgi:hypothetical protein